MCINKTYFEDKLPENTKTAILVVTLFHELAHLKVGNHYN